jgi:hypothetical protein
LLVPGPELTRPGPNSKIGVSQRVDVVTASARSLPARICCGRSPSAAKFGEIARCLHRVLAAKPEKVYRAFNVSVGTELNIVQEGLPDMIPPEACYLGWQESLRNLARLVEPEINQ